MGWMGVIGVEGKGRIGISGASTYLVAGILLGRYLERLIIKYEINVSGLRFTCLPTLSFTCQGCATAVVVYTGP